MASVCGASIFSSSPSPTCYQQHGSRLLFCPPQRMLFLKLSESAASSGWSFPSALKAQVACSSDTIELPAPTSETLDTESEALGRHSRLTPLIAELTEGANLASAVEPWLDRLSIFDWKNLVQNVGDNDWSKAWQLVSYLKEKVPAVSPSVLWPPREKKTVPTIGRDEGTDEDFVLAGSSAAEMESTPEEDPSVTPKEMPAIQELYKALANVLSKNKRADEMDNLLQQLKDEGIKPSSSFYNIMLDFNLSENLTEKCLNLVSEMKEAGINILPATYEKIAFYFMKKDPPDTTLPTYIMRDLMNKGLPVSESMFKNLLKAYWRNKDIEGAEEVFRIMQAAGHTPDQKAIFKVIHCQKLVGNYERILELMEMMTNLGITPNINVYDELISAYCKAGLMEKAKESLSLYDTKLGKKPTLVAFNNLIHGYGKQGRFEEALQAFEDIQNNDYRPDAVSFSSVIAAMSNAGQLTKALQIYRRMVRQGMQPKLHTYITLIRGLTKLDWTRDGRKIANAMRKSPHSLTPEAFGAIFSLFVEGHWYHLAASVLMEMENEGFPLNEEGSSGLIRSFGNLEAKPTPLSKTVENSTMETCKLLTALFLAQSDDGSTMESLFEKEMVPYLEKFQHVDDARVMYNSFMDCLWKRGQKVMTERLLSSAREVYAQSTKPEARESEWVLDVRCLSVGGAKCALSQWLTWAHDHGGSKQSSTGTETSEGSNKLEGPKMVIVIGKDDQLSAAQSHGMLKSSITKMLADLKSPFVELSGDPEKLEAPAALVLKWAISDEVKELIDTNDCLPKPA